MTLTFQAEDFISNNFYSNTDCAICRAAERKLKLKVSAGGDFFRTWSGEPYSGDVLVYFRIPDTYGAPEFEKAQKAVVKGTFIPFSIEVDKISENETRNTD